MPLNEGHDGFEDEFGAAIRRTGDGFATEDGRGLVTGGLTRGRRLVKRRRAAAVTGGVLAFALVGVGGVYAGDLLGSGTEAEGSSVAAPRGTAPEGALGAVLKANTPPGTWSFDHSDAMSVSAVYEDGKGPAGVTVGLYRAGQSEESSAGQVTCPDKTYVPHDACKSDRLPNGDRLMVLQGYEFPDRRTDTKTWRAVLLTKDGFLVDASESNAAGAKDSAVTRTDPPFSPAQLETLVTAPGWRPLLEKLPTQTVPPTPGNSTPPQAVGGADVRATLRSLLPKGLTVVSSGEQDEEFAYVVVNDGKGKSLVQINVQNRMADVAPHLRSGGAAQLPDGRLVLVTEQPGEKGGAGVTAWTAESLTPSGFRVVISAFNTGAQHEAATRAKPALTKAQLREIALSPKWSKFETE
ncbi:hypothetical protein ACF09C_11990 [Streptomyces sp. NPDC014870]|uniref:hypothetical protein n=1 Tax=Streptomyces sp. NPDC014870 TaxID=3364925 RepID=UPI0036F70FA0